MSVASNQYASKVFSEHPVAIWPLDDDAHYLSLIDDAERDLTDWTLTNCSATTTPDLPNIPSPFEDNADYFGIIGDHTVLGISGGTIELRSDPIFMFDSLSQDLKNFSINFYLYQESVYVLSYEFGFRYFDTFLGSYKEVLSVVSPSPVSAWIRFNDTFDVPEFDSDTCEIVLKINVVDGGSSGDYDFVMNALSVGQWSEPFSASTLGSVPSLVPSSAGLTSVYGLQADQYGPLSDNAYYIVEDGRLLARNNGVPLVFGSENCVQLNASSSDLPSFIFPGKGFLSEEGRYKTQTLEFWMKIKPNTKLDRKIFGPLNSNNGIYVSEGFITLSVGDDFQTYNVYEWYRPMLVHIVYNETNCQMYINGEQVAEIEIDRELLVFEEENEWIGFFDYEDIELFEIDCISILPYTIPLQVAKRRFVWGQGVESQQIIDDSFKGTPTAISFPNVEYSANVVYPDKERWDSGYYNNLDTTRTSLTVPEYSLPEIFLSGRDESLWYSANKLVNEIEYSLGDHPSFITFRPNTNQAEDEWLRTGPNWNEKSYLQFSNANIASLPISAIYAIFETEDDIAQDRPLIHIVNALSGKRFEININSYDISYVFDGEEIETIDATGQEHMVVGFHIPTLIESFGSELATFFSSYDTLQIYVGGAPDTLDQQYETFEGKIYRVSFSDASNYDQVSDHFAANGIVNYDEDQLFIGHYSTYTVSPFLKYGKFFLDISIAANWEEYYPLSVFADYAFDTQGNQYFGLDYVQFNIGYPSYIEKNEITSTGPAWTNYANFEQAFSYPIQKSYEILDNELITGYQDYDDLENNVITQVVIDTSNSSVDIFATFQLISEGADEPLDSFTFTKELTQSMSVDAAAENTISDPYKAYKTKFRIVDGTIIYPPKNIKTEDVALTLHFSVNKDAILSHPLTIRDMSISSQALNYAQPNPIGTKFSKKIYPYIKRGIYLDYKSNNPVLVYDKSSPYLYLTEKSGIKVLTYNQINNEYLVSVPINEPLQTDVFIGAAQLFIKFDVDDIIATPFPLFEIQYKSSTIEFVGDIDSSSLRTRVVARDKFTKQVYENIVFYQNGVQTSGVFLEKDHWVALGMVFPDPLDFSSFAGAINIFGGAQFDNISYYLSEGLNEIASVIPRTWQNVLTEDNINNLDWGYWYDENGTSVIKKWKNVYVFAEEQQYSLTASDIYKTYLGINVDIVDDGGGISVLNDDFYVFSDILWSSTVGKPA